MLFAVRQTGFDIYTKVNEKIESMFSNEILQMEKNIALENRTEKVHE